MFRSIGGKLGTGAGVGRHRHAHASSLKAERATIKDDYSDHNEEPEYWRVRLPTDELDDLMWGGEGVPPPALPAPRYQKDWSSHPEKGEDSESAIVDDDGVGKNNESNDNILSALEISAKEPSPLHIPDKIILEDIVWKQRSGFGKYSIGILQHEWEQRRVALFESGILRYYALEKNMEGVKYDPSHATNPEKSPWVYDADQEPRGEMDLRKRQDGDGEIVMSPSSFRRLSSIVHQEKGPNASGVKVQARQKHSDPGPTPFGIDITRRDNNQMWRFCFQSQSIQIEWVSTLKRITFDEVDITEDDYINEKLEGLADHGLHPGDHIIRWEILPVLYPIQVHGIVLEAGKNCVIIADFGLASYDNRRYAKDEGLTTWDAGNDYSHDVIVAAWEKIKPKEKKRLNVNVVTDPREIRKWSKINYGNQGSKDKKSGGFLSSLLPWEKSLKKTDQKSFDESKCDKDTAELGDKVSVGNEPKDESVGDESSEADELTSSGDKNGYDVRKNDCRSHDVSKKQPDGVENDIVEGEPDWFRSGYRSHKQTSFSTMPVNGNGQSVFSIDQKYDRPRSELPKSDSAKLVLARTHFILENEDLLPPYHVFYSNSECIAVWCKTGRWSTLQAAVYLVTSSVGFGKSATMLTITAAAAHAILVPALAVGGLAVVSAPLLFLKKSQGMWDKATMCLTDEFWSRADPDVFVEAIKYWARLGRS